MTGDHVDKYLFNATIPQAGRLRAAVTHHGLPHDFCLFEGASPGARAAVGRMAGLMAAGCPA